MVNKKIKYSNHVEERIQQREISKPQIDTILQQGKCYINKHDIKKLKFHFKGKSVVIMDTKKIFRVLTVFEDKTPRLSKRGKVIFKEVNE